MQGRKIGMDISKYGIKNRSTVDPLDGFFCYLYAWLLLTFFYRSILLIPIPGYTEGVSSFVFGLIVALVEVLGFVTRYKICLRRRGIIADIFCGIGIYTAIAYRIYFGTLIIVLTAIFLLFLVAILMKTAPLNIYEEELLRRDNRYRFVIRKLKSVKVFRRVSMVGSILTLILILPILYVRIVYGGILVTKNDFKDSSSEGFLERDVNYENIMKFKEEEWSELSFSEKREAANDLAFSDLNRLGISTEISFVVDVLEEGVWGYYCDEYKTICIDSEHLSNGSPEEVMSTVLHEVYHVWEYELVRLYVSAPQAQKGLNLFDSCEDYIDEINDYQTGTNDFGDYYNQSMEIDARAYGRAATLLYYDMIDEILEEQ